MSFHSYNMQQSQRPQIRPHPVITPEQCFARNNSAPYIFYDPTEASPELKPKANFYIDPSTKPAAGSPSRIRNSNSSPFANGRRNSNYNNPTYHSSVFSDHGNDNISQKDNRSSNTHTPRSQREEVSPQNPIYRSQSGELRSPLRSSLSPNNRNNQEPQNLTQIPTFGEIDNEESEVHHVRRASQEVVQRKRDSPYVASYKKSNSIVVGDDACVDCFNTKMIFDKEEKQLREKEYERELERKTLEHSRRLHQKMMEGEKQKRVVQREIAQQNYQSVLKKHGHYVPNFEQPKKTVFEQRQESNREQNEQRRIKSLHQSILDKIFEASDLQGKKKKNEGAKSISYNKTQIENNEGLRRNRPARSSMDYSPEAYRNLLDKMHDNSIDRERRISKERLSASTHNLNTSMERQASGKKKNDNLNVSISRSNNLDRSFEGKNIVVKMYEFHDDLEKEKQEKIKNTSHTNFYSILKNEKKNKAESISVERPMSAEKVWGYNPSKRNSQSNLFEGIYQQRESTCNKRQENVKACQQYNQGEGYAKNAYSKKNLDLDEWTDQSANLFTKIQNKSEQTAKNQYLQRQQNKNSLRSQIEAKLSKVKEEEVRRELFQEKPLLVCSHKASVNCCGICNKNVASHKMGKSVVDPRRATKTSLRYIQKAQ